MEFFIRQGSSEPKLKMRLIDDGKNYKKSTYGELLENCEITFEMSHVDSGVYQILNKPCYLTTRLTKHNHLEDEYYIIYQFSEEETIDKGRFEGKITIQYLDTELNPTTKLILPIKEKLFINII
jgi:hypothetical protein